MLNNMAKYITGASKQLFQTEIQHMHDPLMRIHMAKILFVVSQNDIP